jgi:hypothetical protein
MSKVRVCVNIPESVYRAYEDEAKRRDTTVEALVEGMIQNLFEEMRTEEEEGTDHPIFP